MLITNTVYIILANFKCEDYKEKTLFMSVGLMPLGNED